MFEIYHYPRCSTCKRALKWLDAHKIAYKAIDIVEHPPKKAVLKEFLGAGYELRKLFNSSGQLYREGNYKQKLTEMSEAEALRELAAAGKLIKRPLLRGDGIYLVGFKEELYAEALT